MHDLTHQVLKKIATHVYWMPPAPPDRPSLCAVIGDRRTLMLDGGSSKAHARLFLEELAAEGADPPAAVVYTHSHWDHVFGGSELGALVIAHASTAEQLTALAALDWSDEALDARVRAGDASPEHAAHVKAEMPSPRRVEVPPADILFQDGLDIELGRVSVQVRHLGGDHCTESSVMYVEPDRVLFLGDCLYASPAGELRAESTFPLYDAILHFDAELYVEGHNDVIVSRAEIERMNEKMRAAEEAVRLGTAIDAPDEDTDYFLRAFRAGSQTTSSSD